jgi:tetratricopeptide (TPR) repeat protein
MFKLKVVALSIGCAGLMTGCALFQRSAPKTPVVQPMMKVQHAGAEARAKYELGRYYYGQRRIEEARRELEAALALDAALSRASNVLGVIYASQGRYEDAQMQFKRALEWEPQAAHLHSNLGYAYLLQGRNQEALAAFEEALKLEPQSEKAGTNLRMARERLGLEGGAAKLEVVDGASATKTTEEPSKPRIIEIAPNVYELTLPSAITSGSIVGSRASATPTPMSGQTESSPVVKMPDQVVEVSPNVYELGDPTTRVARPDFSSEARTNASRVGVEVSNGNGIRGMAKRVATALRSQGISVTRVSNRKPFDHPRTEIEYRKGFLTSAHEIGVRLPSPPSFIESESLRSGIGVRLVLGKDVDKNIALADPNASKLASLPWGGSVKAR